MSATTVRTTRSRSAGALLAALVLAALIIGGWNLGTTLVAQSRAPASVGQTIGVPGGELTVLRGTAEQLAHNPGMPGMMMPQGLPEDMRRVTIEFTLAATGGTLDYAPEALTLTSSDGEAELARDQLGRGQAPEGTTIDGSLTYVVPADVERLELSYEGARRSVVVEVPAGEAEAGHADDGVAGGHGENGGHEPGAEHAEQVAPQGPATR